MTKLHLSLIPLLLLLLSIPCSAIETDSQTDQASVKLSAEDQEILNIMELLEILELLENLDDVEALEEQQ